MGIVKTETFTNKNGIEMRKDTYANGMTITHATEQPKIEATVPEPTQLDKIEAGLAYSNMMQEG